MSLPRVLLVYHFFHPDEVVSARLFTDLALGLRARGWDVTALTSARAWDAPSRRYPAREVWEGIAIERVSRPPWDQGSAAQRLLNSAWMISAWLAHLVRLRRFDAIVLGSDPAFAPALFLPVRRVCPNVVLAHWCYDVYPDAIAADRGGPLVQLLMPLARALMAASYGSCDAIVDIGPRMRERLSLRPTLAVRETLVPWALTVPTHAPRPPDTAIREHLFGKAALTLLYSGTLGRAHDFTPFLALARECRISNGEAIAFCLCGRGNGFENVRRSLRSDDTNVRLFPFTGEAELERRLESADIHLLSIRDEWSGVVVPSKFFGALAVGRPVLYSGPPDSDVAHWIRELNVGWELTAMGLSGVIRLLREMAVSRNELAMAQRRARAAYDQHFGKELIIDRWDSLLRGILARRRVHTRRGGRSAFAETR